MKNFTLCALVAGAFFVTSCSSDDDSSSSKDTVSQCETCTTTFEEGDQIVEYCDIGGGKYTATPEGEEPVENTLPSGVSFSTLISSLIADPNTTCN